MTPKNTICLWFEKDAEAKRAFDAKMTMQKIDVATIKAARRG